MSTLFWNWHHDKPWVSHVFCRTRENYLWAWKAHERQCLPIDVPIKWIVCLKPSCFSDPSNSQSDSIEISTDDRELENLNLKHNLLDVWYDDLINFNSMNTDLVYYNNIDQA